MSNTLRTATALVALSLGTAVGLAHCPPDCERNLPLPRPVVSDPPVEDDATAAAPSDDAWLKQFASDPESAAGQRFAAMQKKRLATERDLKIIRAKHFKGIRGTELRQAGIARLKEYTDPAIFPAILEIFGPEGEDVQYAMLDHWSDLNIDEADATIAWAAIFGSDKPFRLAATKRLLKKAQAAEGQVSNRVKSVIAIGLRKERSSEVAAAAELANVLQLYEAIPALIAAQVSGSAGGARAEDGGDAALAYILVGTQVAFVSDLNPVVGDNAVAFDPELSVATEGVVLRVIDAFVVTYHIEVNRSLIGLANKGWDGRDTSPLGWNTRAWKNWYVREFLPHRQTVDAAKRVVSKP